MRIVMPCENLSANGSLRVYPFAKIMSEEHDITVLGPIEKKGIFTPIKNDLSVKYVSIPKKYFPPGYIQNQRDIYKQLNDAELIHAFKVTAWSYLPSLLQKIKHKKKIVLDIDDWESQYVADYYFKANPIKLAKFTFVDAYTPESYFIKKILETQVKKADAVITSSKTLQRMFGGTWIPTGPNTDYFNPENFSGKKIREEFRLEDKTIILFMGTPKKHKGVDELIQAVEELRTRDESLHLLIVGAEKDNSYVQTLKENQGLTIVGYRDNKEMPDFLAAADIVCIPHKNNKSANAQLPIKIFEPMAMEKPVITTDTTDMKEIFEDCGQVIKPDSVEALKEAIVLYLNNKELRLQHGKKARQECLNKYSWKIMKKKTQAVYDAL
ncbi:MAG: group 1 glycosyl transferase [archaeon GW2011_AR17]|nr:MAG: group 1 glycosyl transferase [archaeon GW2011_AR17]HIH15109.1 glycosyltransferase family 4 protein [Nanoarchaeota archaeon]HIH58718.1 glycosyltransferase family 4 protein [Nanoarchaeota archaeon]HII14509.1 glycosyltransferase family 4 protein [Nanoarchaeota archaeon]HIJ04479.1 glycosyltransferase family 4 protein [Nanoarchaeota archaeon]